MKEEITWQYTENKADTPIRGSWYLLKGYIIEKGRNVRIARFECFNGSDFQNCDDMIIERYARIVI